MVHFLNSGLQMLIQNSDLCNIILAFRDKSDVLSNFAKFIDDYHNNSNDNPIDLINPVINPGTAIISDINNNNLQSWF